MFKNIGPGVVTRGEIEPERPRLRKNEIPLLILQPCNKEKTGDYTVFVNEAGPQHGVSIKPIVRDLGNLIVNRILPSSPNKPHMAADDHPLSPVAVFSQNATACQSNHWRI
jgi:hypothetical protein